VRIELNGQAPTGDIRVLVIDGQADGRWAPSLALMAQPAMKMVGLVRPGPEAIRRAARHRPDLVLLDIGGSSVAGLELLRRLKARPGPPRVVLIADVVPAGLRAAMREAGADGIVARQAFALPLMELVDRFFAPPEELLAIPDPCAAPAAAEEGWGSAPSGPRRVAYRRVPRGERAIN
jgi:CheY-like chemotaxis protein